MYVVLSGKIKKIDLPLWEQNGWLKGCKRKFFDNPNIKSVKQKQVICPHCNKQGGANAMKRYHFNNCKLNCK